jgi:putative phosphoribosyl transferase
LDGDLDVIVARKLGSPFSPELAVGAVTADGTRYLNAQTIDEPVSRGLSEHVTKEKRGEARSARTAIPRWQGPIVSGRPHRDPRRRRTRNRIDHDRGCAVCSCAPPAAARDCGSGCSARDPMPCTRGDEVICLGTPAFFMAVGLHYRDFSQTEDEDGADPRRMARTDGGGVRDLRH